MLKRCFSNSVANHLLKNAYKGWEGVTPEKNFYLASANIIGEVPKDLKGTYLRNGPGLIEKYGHKLIHPIDGDGMVCALSFPGNGSVHFKNRFVETDERIQETSSEQFLFRGQMGSITDKQREVDSRKVKDSFVTGKLPKIKFRNPSNTNTWYWGDRIISAYETAIPYALDPTDLSTIGKEDFNNTLRLKRLGAHFRIDTSDSANHRLVTGAFVRSPLKSYAALEINEYNWDFTLHRSNIFEVEGLTYFHDLAIIDDYYVIHSSPYVTMDMKVAAAILSGTKGPEYNMTYNKDLPSQFIFLPKCGTKQPIIVDTPFPFHMYHFGTCYTNDNNVVLTATALTGPFDMSWEHRYWLSNMCKAPGKFIRFDVNLQSGSVSYDELDPASNEFPTSNPYRHGHANTKYNYLMACDLQGRGLPFMDIVKVDASQGASARKVWRADGLVSECVFAPKAGFNSSSELDEDDGWLLTQFYNPDVPDETQFLILDAKNVEAGPVCRINLGFKVPYPFHGTFTPAVFCD